LATARAFHTKCKSFNADSFVLGMATQLAYGLLQWPANSFWWMCRSCSNWNAKPKQTKFAWPTRIWTRIQIRTTVAPTIIIKPKPKPKPATITACACYVSFHFTSFHFATAKCVCVQLHDRAATSPHTSNISN